MYKFIYVIFIFLFFSCSNVSGDQRSREADINAWYERQTYYAHLNSDSVLYYATLIEKASKKLAPEFQAMALIGKARHYGKTNPERSVNIYRQALALVGPNGEDTIVARIYNGIGVYHRRKSEYSQALDYFFKALRLYEKSLHPDMSGVLANIGEVYQEKGDVPSAKNYIRRAMDLSQRQGHIIHYLDAAHTLANIYGMNNQFDSAMAIDRMGIIVAQSLGAERFISSFYNNIGNCYLYSNKPDSARYYFMQCLRMDSAASRKHFMVDNYLTLGQLSLQQRRLRDAEQYFKRAIQLSDTVQESQLKAVSWKNLSSLYEFEKNYKQALFAKDSAAAIKDRMINEKSEQKIAELREIYETEKKEQTIVLQELQLSRQRFFLLGSIVLIGSLIFSGWLWYRKYSAKKDRERQAALIQEREQATLDILQAEIKERKRIATELHDGIGQVMLAAWMNLQALEPQTGSLDPAQQHMLENATKLVGEGCREVREVSHAMMPETLLRKGLAGALREMTDKINSKVIEIRLHVENLSEPLDNVVESILFRIIQELMNNTIKHAGATELDISLNISQAGIALLMEDNGNGFDVQHVLVNESNTGLGLRNIKSRVTFLHGTVEWDSSIGNGTAVSIFIPLKNYHG